MKNKTRYFTIYYIVYDSIETKHKELNITEMFGNYPSRDKYIKELKDSVFKHHGYVNIVITNVIEYKNKADYMNYILPWE